MLALSKPKGSGLQTFRVAFLGAGRIGQMHLTNLNTIPGVTVQVVADTNADMAARGAAIVNAPRHTNDIMAAIAADDVDASRYCFRKRKHGHVYGSGVPNDVV